MLRSDDSSSLVKRPEAWKNNETNNVNVWNKWIGFIRLKIDNFYSCDQKVFVSNGQFLNGFVSFQCSCNSLCSFLPPLLLIVKRIPFTELRPCRHCTRHVICLILKRSHPSKSPSSLFGIPMVLVINFSHFSDNSNRFLISSGTHDDGNGSIWLEVKDTQLTMAQTRRLSYILIIIQLKTQINLERDFLVSFFWWRLH